jgi:Mrp family chromosome partitioning ATPase
MVHRLHDQPLEPGLCELVRDEVDAADVTLPTAVENLFILPAGRFNDDAQAALAQAGVPALFNQFREQFEFVIVDSAPVLAVADSLLLSLNVDAVLFSILRDLSQAPRVQAARDRIAALGVPILGAVVIGIKPASYYRSYYKT